MPSPLADLLHLQAVDPEVAAEDQEVVADQEVAAVDPSELLAQVLVLAVAGVAVAVDQAVAAEDQEVAADQEVAEVAMAEVAMAEAAMAEVAEVAAVGFLGGCLMFSVTRSLTGQAVVVGTLLLILLLKLLLLKLLLPMVMATAINS